MRRGALGAILAVALWPFSPACSGDESTETAGTGGAAGAGPVEAGSDAPLTDHEVEAEAEAASCPDKTDVSKGGAASADGLYPSPRFVDLGDLGARAETACLDTEALAQHQILDALAPKLVATLGLAFVDAASCDCDWKLRFEPDPLVLSSEAQSVWVEAAGNPERYEMRSESAGGRALTSLYAPNERAAIHAAYSALGLAQPDGDGEPPRIATASVVDYPAFGTRAVLEGFYGTPYTTDERKMVIRIAARLRQSAYVYGPKNDAYAREKWAEPYPAAQSQALADAAAEAKAHGLDFVWSVSPGLPFAAIPPGSSIKYSSAADFQKLTAKIESVRALGVTRFALFLDDLTGFLVWPEDIAEFPALVDAHASLMNELDDYLKSKDPDHHLVVVGSEYTSFWPTWVAYNDKLGQLLNPGIEVMWTGPGIYSSSIQASDLDAINQKLGRKVSLWDNGPQSIAPLTGRAADLEGAIGGIFSNAVVNEFGKYPPSAFLEVQGTLADWAWNPASYDPDASFAQWKPLLAAFAPVAP